MATDTWFLDARVRVWACAKTSCAAACALFLLLCAGCEEIAPTLNVQEPGTGGSGTNVELSEQPRGVLIEEFTGVRCVNCPAGAEAIAQLKATHGDRLVPVALHTGFFSAPYQASTQDFRTGDADAIETLVGGPQGYPSAVINRRRFEGEQALQLAPGTWAGYVEQALAEEPLVGLGLRAEVDDANVLTVNVEWLGRAGTAGRDANLTVLLLEGDIADLQKTPTGDDPDYVHEHALREAITAPGGAAIGAVAAAQRDSLAYTVSLPSDYVLENLEVVAFIHYADGDAGGKEVLQAVGVAVD